MAAAEAPPAEQEGGRQTYSLSQSIDLAFRQNPRLQGIRRQAAASRDGANSQRGRLLPTIHVGATYDYVRANEGLNLAGLTSSYGSNNSNGSGSTSAPLKIDFWGGDFSASAAQPLLGLLHIGQDWAAENRAADAAQADVHSAEQQLRNDLENGFLTLFEARAEKGIAQASHDQLTEQLQVAQVRLRDGELTQADVLRFQVAAANADQQQIQAQVQEENARDLLVSLLGLSGSRDREGVDFSDPTDQLALRQLPSEPVPAQEQLAEAQRPELRSAEDTRDSAWHRKQARFFNLLPELNASYTYYRLINVPSALPRDIELMGFSASWNIFTWGTDYYQARQAGELYQAAADNRESVRQQVDLEVRTRAAQERSASSAVKVASDTIAQAEEAFRVTQATVRAGAATTTDLLDAQAALTQARLNLVRSRYEELRARTALLRALGEI